MKARTHGAEQRRKAWARQKGVSRNGMERKGPWARNGSKWPPCRPRGGRWEEGGRSRKSRRWRGRCLLPRPIHRCTDGKSNILLFSSRSFQDFFFFFCFVLFCFFKKSLKISYWLHLQNVKCCCYQSLYRTVQSGQILTNKVSFSFFFFLLHHYYSMSHVSACVGQGAA